MRRVRGSRFSNLTVGLLVTLIIVPIVFLAFTKHVPFTHQYRISAVFRSALNIRSGSPVRIAGVEVGKITGISSYGDEGAARVDMEIADKGLPIHEDATLKLRPRLFLEGNFFVDLRPGSPSAKTIPQGYVIPITQTANPVQIDQVFSTLTQPIRTSLQQTLAGFGQGLSQKPTAAQDAQQDPLVQGKTGAEALNDTYRRSGPVEKSASLVNQALLGTQVDDVPQLVAAIGSATQQLGEDGSSLQGLFTNLNTTMNAFASQSSNLQQAISLLPGALHATTRAFAGITAVAPPLTVFARGFTVVAKQLPESYAVTEPWIAATLPLLGTDELGGIAHDLRVSAPDLDAIVASQAALSPLIDQSALCGTNVVLPTISEKIDDGSLSTGLPNYQELWHGLVGFGGSAQNLDGNGFFARLFAGAGNTVVTSGAGPDGKVSGGRAAAPPLGTSPKYPGFGKTPPFKPNVNCSTQARPNLNGPLAHGAADKSRTP